MIIAFALTFSMITVSVTFHYWGLCALSRMLSDSYDNRHHFFRAVGILHLMIGIHLMIILSFSLMFWLASDVLKLGTLCSQKDHVFMDYLYHAAVSYTTLGLSHVPLGHLKIMTALVSLAGIMLLTWSATFYYTTIGKIQRLNES